MTEKNEKGKKVPVSVNYKELIKILYILAEDFELLYNWHCIAILLKII